MEDDVSLLVGLLRRIWTIPSARALSNKLRQEADDARVAALGLALAGDHIAAIAWGKKARSISNRRAGLISERSSKRDANGRYARR